MKYIEREDEVEVVIKSSRAIEVVSPSSVIRVRKGQKWEPIIQTITEEVGHQYLKEVNMLCSLIAMALRYNRLGSQVSLDRNAFSAANRLTRQGLSYRKTKRLLPLLEELGYIELYIGYYNVEKGYGVPSFFLITEKMRDLWQDIDLSSAPKRDEPDVIVRDSLTKEDKPTRGMRGIVLLREDLNAYNQLLRNSHISIQGEELPTEYKRVYHDTLQGGGRYYSINALQTLPKGERPLIKINGYDTVELDFSSMHPRVLYSLEYIQLHPAFSPYNIAGVTREEAKQACLCLLYSTSRLGAIRALVHGKYVSSFERAEIVVALVERHNKAITKYFGKSEMWKVLQHIDSKIASHVLTAMVARKLPVLPWHDSFVAELYNEPILRGLMFDAWRRELGSTVNCVVEQKYP